MDPRLAEEIKRRNKLKLQQWEDKLKIVGKFDKSDNTSDEAPETPVQQKPKMPFNEIDSELTSMFDTMQGIQNAQSAQNEQTQTPQKSEQVGHVVTQPQTAQVTDSASVPTKEHVPTSSPQQTTIVSQPVSKEDEILSKFDIGPFNIAQFAQAVSSVISPHVTTPAATTSEPTTATPETTRGPVQPDAVVKQHDVATSNTHTPPVQPAVQEDANAKYIHIDIVEGKIKLARKNMSIEEAVSLLAKVYNSYKSKM